MDKYLKRLCNAIIAGRFNDENYRQKRRWNGKDIMTEPLFSSYGRIGFTVAVYEYYDHFCTIQYDAELNQLSIDDTPWKDYINLLYLEDFDITDNGGGEIECFTDAGEDMIITLDKVRKKNLQDYIDEFDINEEVLLWWQNGKPGKGVPFSNVKEHYEDYEKYLKRLQKICDKMPF